MTVALAPVAFTASATVLNTGTPSTFEPALPGVTPPTIFVPYSSICWVWNVPTAPVIPWTRTFVFLLIQMLMFPPSIGLAGGGHDFDRCVLHVGRGDDVEFRCVEDFPPLLDVGAFETNDERHLEAERLYREDD